MRNNTSASHFFRQTIRQSNSLFFQGKIHLPKTSETSIPRDPPQKIPKPSLPTESVKQDESGTRPGSGSRSHGGGRVANLYINMSRLLGRGFRQRKQASKKWPSGRPPALAPARPPPPPPPPDAGTSSSSTPELTSRVHAAADAPPPLPLQPPPPPLPVLPATLRPKSIGGGEEEPTPGLDPPPRPAGAAGRCDRARTCSVARVFVSARRCEGEGRDGRCAVSVCLKGRQEVEWFYEVSVERGWVVGPGGPSAWPTWRCWLVGFVASRDHLGTARLPGLLCSTTTTTTRDEQRKAGSLLRLPGLFLSLLFFSDVLFRLGIGPGR
jgi:hypothetical protein